MLFSYIKKVRKCSNTTSRPAESQKEINMPPSYILHNKKFHQLKIKTSGKI